MEFDESSLVSSCRRGDRDAYGKIVERYQVRVYDLVLLMVCEPGVAEDVAQEAFIRGFVKIDKFNPERRFLPWILKIAINLARDYLRASARRELPHPPEALEARSRQEADMEAGIDQKDRFARMEKALVELPLKYRTPLLLKHAEGLSYREMSEVLGLSTWVLKMRVSRARARLRGIMRLSEPKEQDRATNE